MYAFRKPAPAKSVMFAVRYEDGRTAYLWVEEQSKFSDERILAPIAAERQRTGALPEGEIVGIKRVR